MTVPRPNPIKAILASRRISQRALAHRVGCSYRHLSRIVNAHARPSPELADAISTALGLPTDALFREIGGGSAAPLYPGDVDLMAGRP